MALVLCFHFQLGELRGLNMSVVSERMSSQSCSVSPSCNCLFIVYSITGIWHVFFSTLRRTLCISVNHYFCFLMCGFQAQKHSPKKPYEAKGMNLLLFVCLCTHIDDCVFLCARTTPRSWPKSFQSAELEVGLQYLEQWTSGGKCDVCDSCFHLIRL